MLAVILAAAIFLTLVYVIWQPKGSGIGWTAYAGAVSALPWGFMYESTF